jgi:hypothetical protein
MAAPLKIDNFFGKAIPSYEMIIFLGRRSLLKIDNFFGKAIPSKK